MRYHIIYSSFIFVITSFVYAISIADTQLLPDKLRTELFWQQTDAAEARALLEQIDSDDINQEDEQGWTIFSYAAAYAKDEEVLREVKRSGGDLSVRTTELSLSLLHLAARYNPNPDVIEELVDLGLDENDLAEDDWTPLHVALRFVPSVNTIEALLDEGAKIDARTRQHGLSPLVVGIRINPNYQATRLMLKKGASINLRDTSGQTALHAAARFVQDYATAELIIESAWDMNLRDPDNNTPLHLAAQFAKDPRIIELLIKKGANANYRNKDDLIPFALAASLNPNPRVLDVFLQRGFSVNTIINPSSRWSVLNYAAANNPSELVITHLINRGANPMHRDIDNQIPLHLAVKKTPNPRAIAVLLEHTKKDALVSSEGYDWQCLALSFNYHTETIRWVIAQLNKKTIICKDPYSLLQSVAMHNINGDALSFLFLNGNSANAKNAQGQSLLHIAAQFNPSGEVLETLVKAGNDPNARDNDGNTPLSLAARSNYSIAIIETLLALGSQPSIRNKEKLTPIQIASQSNNLYALNALLKRSVDHTVLTKKSKQNLAHLVAQSDGDTSLLRQLKEIGVDFDAKDAKGNTPLHLTAWYGRESALAEFLIKTGVQLEPTNKQGYTPLHIAARYGPEPAVLEYLLSSGASPTATEKQWGATPLLLAARYNANPIMVFEFARLDGAKNQVDTKGNNALHTALRYNTSSEVANALLDFRFSVDTPNRVGRTPLQLAARYSDSLPLIERMLKLTKDPFITTKQGQSLIALMKKNNRLPVDLSSLDSYFKKDKK